ncbi:hypothetical protein [Phormidium sp. CCY1219]|uniref:hypothetical protein n=1 Tax=Phormidium sp. CCY1219 TaxID=2886104 RepID=UPI002D1E8E3E|nr:hypothetical protein [Phormidium sp. CCY1219]MEB3826293.1 hypothetical protein [Phormidium sp. CCY1219]
MMEKNNQVYRAQFGCFELVLPLNPTDNFAPKSSENMLEFSAQTFYFIPAAASSFAESRTGCCELSLVIRPMRMGVGDRSWLICAWRAIAQLFETYISRGIIFGLQKGDGLRYNKCGV